MAILKIPLSGSNETKKAVRKSSDSLIYLYHKGLVIRRFALCAMGVECVDQRLSDCQRWAAFEVAAFEKLDQFTVFQ